MRSPSSWRSPDRNSVTHRVRTAPTTGETLPNHVNVILWRWCVSTWSSRLGDELLVDRASTRAFGKIRPNHLEQAKRELIQVHLTRDQRKSLGKGRAEGRNGTTVTPCQTGISISPPAPTSLAVRPWRSYSGHGLPKNAGLKIRTP